MTLEYLPWSRESEQSLLGAILNDSSRAMEYAKPLAARQFFDLRHAQIFTAMESMTVRKVPVDVVTVYEEIGAAMETEDFSVLQYLHTLSKAASGSYGASRYAEIIREKAAKRELMEAAEKTADIAAGDGAAPEKIDKITSLFIGLQRQQVQKVPRSLAEIALMRTQHYEDLKSGKAIAGWTTGISSLDKMLNGGFRPGGLYILAARPSVGKSSLSQTLGMTQSKDGRKVLFLSQEMASEELADRGVSNSGQINYSNLLSGELSDAEWSRASNALEAASLGNFHVDDQGALSLSDIRAKAKLVPGLSVLILDYLQLCAGDSSNRNSEIEQISRGLKALAKELGIAVLALSQLNRKVEDRASKRPNLSDLRDSGAIEQDADVVMFLWPVRELDEGSKLIGFGIEKNRQGRTGAFGLQFNGGYQTWFESFESLQQETGQQKSNKGFQL